MAFFRNLRRAIANLNPDQVRELASRPVHIGLVAPTQERMWALESFLCPSDLPSPKRAEVVQKLHRISWDQRPRQRYDLEIWDRSLAAPKHAFSFDPSHPGQVVKEVLARYPDLAVPLARTFPPFRNPGIEATVARIAKENAMFSVATAIPDVVPFLALPWAIGEFASDTAFLTMNQIRMAFLIAAANGCPVGYREQKRAIASVVAAAFGFRAVARELVAKIPFGGGLIPKAAIAYAGTQVLGRSMERLMRTGSGISPEERRTGFEAAYERGKEIVSGILDSARKRQLAADRP